MRSTILWISVASCLAVATVYGTAVAQTPAAVTAPDDTWVSLSGTIVSTTGEAFMLDYGDGLMTVEMDDFDAYPDARPLMVNDQVTVYGRVDDDFYEARTIEASSVYVEELGTSFYASAADEEAFNAWTVTTPIVVGAIEMTGEVTNVTGREFMVDTGASRIQVDTNALAYNPMDDMGYQQIDVGDRIKVSGHMDHGVIDDRELEADWIIVLDNAGGEG
ncbi:MAG TPA: NirD/YgiW/YdeI family stress tolerance protein [Polyangiaceae bacterium LLY-WYZ-14_1]|nr:NirD/YgiW/YdeI family stress tolerance protein [Polyangiaceae bacterium LLY-WYZ-14_1]